MPVAALIRLVVGLLAPEFDRLRLTQAVRRAAIAGCLLLLAGLALLTAIGLAGAALWTFTSPQFGPAGASLILAGVFVLLALLLLLGASLARRPRQQPATPPPPANANPADALLALAGSLFGNNKTAFLVATVIAGLLAARQQNRD